MNLLSALRTSTVRTRAAVAAVFVAVMALAAYALAGWNIGDVGAMPGEGDISWRTNLFDESDLSDVAVLGADGSVTPVSELGLTGEMTSYENAACMPDGLDESYAKYSRIEGKCYVSYLDTMSDGADRPCFFVAFPNGETRNLYADESFAVNDDGTSSSSFTAGDRPPFSELAGNPESGLDTAWDGKKDLWIPKPGIYNFYGFIRGDSEPGDDESAVDARYDVMISTRDALPDEEAEGAWLKSHLGLDDAGVAEYEGKWLAADGTKACLNIASGMSPLDVSFTKPGYSTLSVSAASSDESITKGDGYRLQGIGYGLYRDEACTDLVAKGTLNDGGRCRLTGLANGATYYVRQIDDDARAASGYASDDTAYEVKADAGPDQSRIKHIELRLAPLTSGGIRVQVSNANGTDADGYAAAPGTSLSGGAYVVTKWGSDTPQSLIDGYYAGAEGSSPMRAWELTAKDDGGTPRHAYVSLDDAHFVKALGGSEGDDSGLYRSGGSVVLPIGRYAIAQTKAPDGYHGDGTKAYVFDVVLDADAGGCAIRKDMSSPWSSLCSADEAQSGGFAISCYPDGSSAMSMRSSLFYSDGSGTEQHTIPESVTGSVRLGAKVTIGGSLDADAKYRLVCSVHMLEFGDDGTPALSSEPVKDGNSAPFTAAVDVVPDGNSTVVSIPSFDGSDLESSASGKAQLHRGTYAGRVLVMRSVLYRDGEAVLSDTEPVEHEKSVYVPTMGTELSGGNGQKTVPSGRATSVDDHVTIYGADPEEEYSLVPSLHHADDGSAVTGMEAVADDGIRVTYGESTIVTQSFQGDVPVQDMGKTVVAFEELRMGEDGTTVISHDDLADRAQSMTVSGMSVSMFSEDGTHEAALGSATRLNAGVEYGGLSGGETYTARLALYYSDAQRRPVTVAGTDVIKDVTFVSDASGAGTVREDGEDPHFVLDATQLSFTDERRVVLFVNISRGDAYDETQVVSSYEDMVSGDNMVSFGMPTIDAVATIGGSHYAQPGPGLTIDSDVSVTGLGARQAFTVVSELHAYDPQSGNVGDIVSSGGKEIVASGDGTTDDDGGRELGIKLPLDASELGGGAYVVVSSLYGGKPEQGSRPMLTTDASAARILSIVELGGDAASATDHVTLSHVGAVEANGSSHIDISDDVSGLFEECELVAIPVDAGSGDVLDVAYGGTLSATVAPGDGHASMSMSVDDASALSGRSVSFTLSLRHAGNEVLSAPGKGRDAMTIRYPSLTTYTIDPVTNGTRGAAGISQSIRGRIDWSNLPEGGYSVIAATHVIEDGKDAGVVSSYSGDISQDQNADSITGQAGLSSTGADGHVVLSVGDEASPLDTKPLKGKTVALFVTLYDGNVPILTVRETRAGHVVTYEEITAPVIAPNGDPALANSTDGYAGMRNMVADAQSLVDTLTCSNLSEGQSYWLTVSFRIRNGSGDGARDGGTVVDAAGKSVTASTSFKASSTTQDCAVTIPLDASHLAGKTIVAYADLYVYDTESNQRMSQVLASYGELGDERQTMRVCGISGSARDSMTNTGTGDTTAGASISVDPVCEGLVPGQRYVVRAAPYLMPDDAAESDSGYLTSEGKLVQEGADVPYVTKAFQATSDTSSDLTLHVPLDASGLDGRQVRVMLELLGEDGGTVRQLAGSGYEGLVIRYASGTQVVPSISSIEVMDGTYKTRNVNAAPDQRLMFDIHAVALEPGETYEAVSKLYCRSSSSSLSAYKDPDGRQYGFSTLITQDGDVTSTLDVDASGIAGSDITVRTSLYHMTDGKPDEQALSMFDGTKDDMAYVSVPRISGTLTVGGVHSAAPRASIGMRNVISYSKLIPGQAYSATATLHMRGGTPITRNGDATDEDGAYTVELPFVPSDASGEVSIDLTIDAGQLSGQTVCVHDSITLHGNGTEQLVASASDDSASRSVSFPSVEATLSSDEDRVAHVAYLPGAGKLFMKARLLALPSGTYELRGALHTGDTAIDGTENTNKLTIGEGVSGASAEQSWTVGLDAYAGKTVRASWKLVDGLGNVVAESDQDDPDLAVEIRKSEYDVTVTAYDMTYGDAFATPSVSNPSGRKVTLYYAPDGSDEWSDSQPSDAGRWQARADEVAGGTHTQASEPCPFTIEVADNAWVDGPSIDDWEKGGTPSRPSGTPRFGTPTFEYSSDGSSWLPFDGKSPAEPGTYYMRGSVPADEHGNYRALGMVPVAFHVRDTGKKQDKWTSYPTIEGWAFGETPSTPVHGKTASGRTGTIEYAASESGPWGTEPPEHAGGYVMRESIPADDEYAGLTAYVGFEIAKSGNDWKRKPLIAGWTYGETPSATVGGEAMYGTPTVEYGHDGSWSGTCPQDAGSYEMRVTVPGGPDWEGLEERIPFVIAQTRDEVTIEAQEQEYGRRVEPKVAHRYADNALTVSYKAPDGTVSGTFPDLPSSGTWTVHVTSDGKGNYEAVDASKTFAVTRGRNAWLDGSPSLTGWKAGGEAPEPKAESLFGTARLTYGESENGPWSDEMPNAAGTHYMHASVAETADYTGLDTVVSYEVAGTGTQENSWVRVPSIAGWEYGATPSEPSAEAAHGDVSYEYLAGGVRLDGVPGDAGSYTLRAVAHADGYRDITAEVPFTISRASNSWDVEPSQRGWRRGEAVPQPEGRARFGETRFEYRKGEDGEFGPLPADAASGDWQMRAYADGNDNYASISKIVRFSVADSGLQPNAWKTAPAIAGWTYGDEASTPVGEALHGSVTYSYRRVGDTAWSGSMPTSAGSYEMLAHVPHDGTYDGLDDVVRFDVAKGTNAWRSGSPAIGDWAYGDAPAVPVVSARFGADKARVEYARVSDLSPIMVPAPADGLDYRQVSDLSTLTPANYMMRVTIEATDDWAPTITETDGFTVTLGRNSWKVAPSCPDVEYGARPEPAGEAEHGETSFSYSQDGREYGEFPDGAHAGKWHMRASATPADGTYAGLSADVEFEVTKAGNAWTEQPAITGWRHGDAANDPSGRAKFGSVSFEYSKSRDGGYAATDTGSLDAGKWYMRASVTGTDDYDGLGWTDPVEFEVTASGREANSWKTPLSCADVEYGHAPDPACEPESGDVTYAYSGSENGPWQELGGPLDVGKWYVRATVPATDTRDGLSSVASFDVTKAHNSWVSGPAIDGWVEGDRPNAPSAKSAYGTPSFSFSNTRDGAYGRLPDDARGTWYMTADVAGTGNYDALASDPVGFEIRSAWSEEPGIDGWAYGDEPKRPRGRSDVGEVRFEVGDGDTWEAWSDASAPRHAGSYILRATVVGANGRSDVSDSVPFTVSRAENAWTEAPAMTGWRYGERPNTPSGSPRFGEAKFAFADREDGAYGELPASPHAGTWYMRANVAGNDDYSALDETVPFEIGRLPDDDPGYDALASLKATVDGSPYDAFSPDRTEYALECGHRPSVELTGVPDGWTDKVAETKTGEASGTVTHTLTNGGLSRSYAFAWGDAGDEPGGHTGDGNTEGSNTDGDHTGGGNTEGDHTGGGNTEGDHTGGGNTEGDHTGGGNTEGDHAGGGNTEDDHAGGNTEDDHTGGGNTEDDHTDGGNTEDDHAGGDNTEDDHAGGDNTEDDHAGGDNTEDDHAGGNNTEDGHTGGSGTEPMNDTGGSTSDNGPSGIRGTDGKDGAGTDDAAQDENGDEPGASGEPGDGGDMSQTGDVIDVLATAAGTFVVGAVAATVEAERRRRK